MVHQGLQVPAHGPLVPTGIERRGRIVVQQGAAPAVARIFRSLYRDRVPVRRMEPIEKYKGSDFDSIEADNTSAFNCRKATGSGRWSNHAYGTAIDINPIENPWVEPGGVVYHAASRPFVKRTARPGVAVAGALVHAVAQDAAWLIAGQAGSSAISGSSGTAFLSSE